MALLYWNGMDRDEWGQLEWRYSGGGDGKDDNMDNNDDRAGMTHHMPLEGGA
jgi:hypothetical protein